jgi:hypothetical protein
MAKDYKKLAGRRYWFRILKLWRGQDHLLLSESMGYAENYKRFYFRDIQAFLISPSSQRVVWNFVWGGFTLTLLILGSSLKSEGSLFVFFLSAFSFSACLINTALGPGCAMRLKTAIQNVELPVSRRRKAEKIIQLLRPVIGEAQQNLPEVPAPTPVTAPGTAFFGTAEVPVSKKFRTHAHWALFSFLLLLAGAVGAGFLKRSLPLYLVEMVAELGATLFAVVALIWQSKTVAPRALRVVTVSALFFVIVNYIVGIVWGSLLGLEHPEFATNYWRMIQWIAVQPLEGSSARMTVAGVQVVVSSILGIIGLLEMASYQRRSR